MDEKVKAQLLEVRASGKSNMLDLPMVQRIAFEMDFYELVMFIEEHKSEYIRFIFHGDS